MLEVIEKRIKDLERDHEIYAARVLGSISPLTKLDASRLRENTMKLLKLNYELRDEIIRRRKRR